MTSQFGTLWRAAYPRLETAFGESLEFQPMAPAGDINGKPGADGTRATVNFTGIFDAEPASTEFEGRGKAGSWTDPVISAPPRVDAPIAAFAVAPRPGDRIRRPLTGEVFTIAEVRPSDLGRCVLHLNKA